MYVGLIYGGLIHGESGNEAGKKSACRAGYTYKCCECNRAADFRRVILACPYASFRHVTLCFCFIASAEGLPHLIFRRLL